MKINKKDFRMLSGIYLYNVSHIAIYKLIAHYNDFASYKAAVAEDSIPAGWNEVRVTGCVPNEEEGNAPLFLRFSGLKGEDPKCEAYNGKVYTFGMETGDVFVEKGKNYEN